MRVSKLSRIPQSPQLNPAPFLPAPRDDLRMRNNPSIALEKGRHDLAHANEVSLSQTHLGTNGRNQFQFGADGKPSKQQLDVWQGALRKSGVSAAQAKRLRKKSEQFLASLCCC